MVFDGCGTMSRLQLDELIEQLEASWDRQRSLRRCSSWSLRAGEAAAGKELCAGILSGFG
jgi:hypothetical protein